MVWGVWNGARLEEAARLYRRYLERSAIHEMERQACLAGGRALEAVRESLRIAWDNLRGAPAAIAAMREHALTVKAAAVAESPDFSCPNGLPLEKTEDDLASFDQSLLTERERDAVAAELFAGVTAAADPIIAWRDSEQLLALTGRSPGAFPTGPQDQFRPRVG